MHGSTSSPEVGTPEERDLFMVKFDRPISAFSSLFKAATAPGFGTVSPKVKAIAAGGLLAFVTGVSAPAFAAAHPASPATVPGVALAANSSNTAPGAGASPAPSINQLHPTGIQGSQVSFAPSADQLRNAQKIIQAGQAMGLPPRAWVIAVATSMQETKLTNYGDLGGSNDHDSLGLFQQRPSSGWGTAAQVQDPTHSSQAFYQALTQVPHWDKMALTDAAQAVQVSAFGDRYAQWEAHAGDVVDAFYGVGPLANAAHQVM
jgi:hypothetical protein